MEKYEIENVLKAMDFIVDLDRWDEPKCGFVRFSHKRDENIALILRKSEGTAFIFEDAANELFKLGQRYKIKQLTEVIKL